MKNAIPVVDLFAGPGGLGEGFGRCRVGGRRAFRSVLSIEKDPAAHRTLTLRAFYRQFDPGEAPPEYFEGLRGAMTTEDLFACRKTEAAARAARDEAWLVELGLSQTPVTAVRQRVAAALARFGRKTWQICLTARSGGEVARGVRRDAA